MKGRFRQCEWYLHSKELRQLYLMRAMQIEIGIGRYEV